MLDSVQIRQLRRHLDTRIELGPLTVLAGPNGVGKSTILEALFASLSALHDSGRSGELATAIQQMGTAEGLRRPDDSSAGIECESQSHQWSGQFDLSDPSRSFRFVEDRKDSAKPFSDQARARFPRPTLLRLRADAIRRPADLRQGSQLHEDGSNLAAVLARLTQLRDGRIEKIEGALKAIVPTVLRVFTENGELSRYNALDSTNENYLAAELFIEFEQIGRVPAAQISSGTLLALGLLTACHGEGSHLLLIDDAEQGLHMDAQHALMVAIQDVLRHTPQLQIVLCTHSPFIMDGAQVEQIVLLGMDPSGRAVHGKLDKHPDAERLLEILSPAELWSSVGEAWLSTAAP